MANKTTGRPTAQARYWDKRLRSPQFKRVLAGVVAGELRAMARERVGRVLDPEFVRRLIREWDARVIDRAVVAELVIANNRRMGERLADREQSLVDLLDRQLVADLEAALEQSFELTPRARDFIANLMQREFVRGLFTDIIFTAIVSFQQKVNPFFGALAVRALEDQIKGFIRLFMPMLQAQATAFAVDRGNQRIVVDFARAVARQLLEVPIGRYAALASSANSKATDALVRRAAKSPKLAELGRKAALASWDDLYETIKGRRLGELLELEAHTDWLAERCVEAVLPALVRPRILGFIAAEMGMANGGKPAP